MGVRQGEQYTGKGHRVESNPGPQQRGHSPCTIHGVPALLIEIPGGLWNTSLNRPDVQLQQERFGKDWEEIKIQLAEHNNYSQI